MFNILVTTVASLILTFVGVIGVYNYVPIDFIEKFNTEESPKFGAVLTTIQGTDSIKTVLGTTIPNNFTALNNGKVENASSTLEGLTSAPNLATIGTITTGVWNGTAIGVLYGGTGTTSPALYRVILGNAGEGLTIASTTGTTGQLFTSNGAGAYPSWQSAAFDTAANYRLTGNWNFVGTTRIQALNASSTASNPIVLNGISLNTPSAQGASSTVLANDGSGNLVWNKLLYDGYELLFSTTTAQNMAAATTTSFATSSELLILIDSRGLASADSLGLKFNNDTAANCGFTQTSAGQSGNESTTAGIEGCNIGSLATTSAQFISVRINNSSAFRKLGMSE